MTVPIEPGDPSDKTVSPDLERVLFAFEGIDERLQLVPLAARRVLDAWGKKLSLAGWLSLSWLDRRAIALAGLGERVLAGEPASVGEALARTTPLPVAIDAVADPDPLAVPADVSAALGAERPLDTGLWRSLAPLERYALAKYGAKPDKLAAAYDEIIALRFTHLTSEGHAHMVNVGAKSASPRRAVASARVRTTPAVVNAVATGTLPKGDVLAVARVAGLMAAKRTPELIPLCHPVQTTHASVDIAGDAKKGEFAIRAAVETVDRTGVEMEAMVAVSVAALTLYDMIKSADRWATIDGVQLEEKSGGKSGSVVRPAGDAR
ncbi:MAG TPA: cyclic pyranopterin monophosphate synthase MoaC [Polyangiaceae bacterium]|jgi:cyclic pyranopterin phosphate synthase|nr:cyclic pyranopterin monophosphate synthase MoaC [Polyangiaceae bacterium]